MSILKSVSLSVSILGEFWQEKINGIVFRWNVLIIILELSFLFLKFNDLPVQVPLYFSLPWGESQLASASTLFLLPAFSIVVLLLNNLLASLFLKSIQLLSRLLVIFSLIFSVLSAISLYKIITLIS